MKIGLHCIYAYDNCMLGYGIKLTMDYIPTVNWSDLPLMMPVWQWYPWKLNLTTRCTRHERWYCLKSVNNNSFSIVYEAKTAQSLFQKNHYICQGRFVKTKHRYKIHIWSDKDFNGTVVNRTHHSFNEVSLGFTFTVQLICLNTP